MFDFIFGEEYSCSQPNAIIEYLKKHKRATTSHIGRIRVNGARICNVALAVHKARKILKKSGQTIKCELVTKRAKLGFFTTSYGVYSIANDL